MFCINVHCPGLNIRMLLCPGQTKALFSAWFFLLYLPHLCTNFAVCYLQITWIWWRWWHNSDVTDVIILSHACSTVRRLGATNLPPEYFCTGRKYTNEAASVVQALYNYNIAGAIQLQMSAIQKLLYCSCTGCVGTALLEILGPIIIPGWSALQHHHLSTGSALTVWPFTRTHSWADTPIQSAGDRENIKSYYSAVLLNCWFRRSMLTVLRPPIVQN